MSAKTKLIRPSGDTTGATDYTNIQAAIDGYTVAASGWGQPLGKVVLDGDYYINDTLRVNSYANRARLPCLLMGTGGATINVASGMTGLHAIEYYGRGNDTANAPRISGIDLRCFYRCRGVLMVHQRYCDMLQDCWLGRTLGIGLDAVDCWGGRASNVTIVARGIALRTIRGHNHTFVHCKFQGQGCWNSLTTNNWSEGGSNQPNLDMWEYERLNGREAAIAYYDGSEGRGTYTEAWPDPDEEVIQGSDGAYIKTPALRRALIVLDNCDHVEMLNVNPEGSTTCSYPLFYMRGSNITLRNVRCETIRAWDEVFVLDSFHNTADYGQCVSIEHAGFTGTTLDSGKCKRVLSLRGGCAMVRVSDSRLRGFSDHIIYAADGTHTQAVVERVVLRDNTIAAEDYLGAAAGASITAEVAL